MKNNNTPAGGFFRMPNAWLRLSVSPGAKILLAQFCASAGKDGESYYSYEQLSEIVGRSKSSVCAYVKELRQAGVISSKEQKTANGFNYRLLITIIDWANLLVQWSSRTAQKKQKSRSEKTECSVQPAERNNDPSGHHKNKIHQNNQTPHENQSRSDSASNGPVVEWSDHDESTWKAFRSSDRNPPFQHGPLPPEALIEKMKSLANHLADRSGLLDPSSSADFIQDRVLAFSKENRLSSSQAELDAGIAAIRETCKTKSQVTAFFNALQKEWKPFWKRLSTPVQIKEIALKAEITTNAQERADLRQYHALKSRLISYEMILKKQQKH